MRLFISSEMMEYLAWVMALVIVISERRYMKRFVLFVLDKLYQLFIQTAGHDH